jgi:hypothetical protein
VSACQKFFNEFDDFVTMSRFIGNQMQDDVLQFIAVEDPAEVLAATFAVASELIVWPVMIFAWFHVMVSFGVMVMTPVFKGMFVVGMIFPP